MSQQLNIPIGADTSGFISDLKKAFDWARKESDSLRVSGAFGGVNRGGAEGGIGSKLNSSLNSRMPDPNRTGLHELGNGGFIRTFESQMQTAGYIAIKTQELFQKASIKGVSDWASKLGSSLRDIIAPFGNGVMGMAKMGGSAISYMTPSFGNGKKSNRMGSGINYPIASLIADDPYFLNPPSSNLPNVNPVPSRKKRSYNFDEIYPNWKGMNDHNRNSNYLLNGANRTMGQPQSFKYMEVPRPYPQNSPLNLSNYEQRNNIIPTINPRDENGNIPSSGGGNRRGNPYWREIPRDERGRFTSRMNSNLGGANNPIAGDKGYHITANIVNITANIVNITTGTIQQGLGGLGGVAGTGAGGGNRTPAGRPPGLAGNITPTQVPRPPKPPPPRSPFLLFQGTLSNKPPPVSPLNPAIPPIPAISDKTKRPPRDPLAFAGDMIAGSVFKPDNKNNKSPSIGERIKNGATSVAEGAGRVVSGVKGTAQSVAGAAAAVIGVAAIGLAIASAMAGVVSDLGEKYTQQAVKQSDTMGALGGRIGGGGGYFVNEEVAKANLAAGRITGGAVYGKGNQISQYEMKFAASMGVGLSEMSGMLAHIRHAEGEAQSIDRIRRKGALLGYKNLQMQQFLQKNVEYDQQRTEQGLSSNFDDVVALASGAFKSLKTEGKLSAAQELTSFVQPKFGANPLSDLMLSKKISGGSGGVDGMFDAMIALKSNSAKELMGFLDNPGMSREGLKGIFYDMAANHGMNPIVAKAAADYTPGSKSSRNALESAFKENNTKVDPVTALTNFLAGHENRQQAIFLNGIGASAYQMSVDLQQQQMKLVGEHKEAFMKTAKAVNEIQQSMMGATAKMIEFSSDIIKSVTEFMEKDSTKGFLGKMKKFMEDFWDNIGDSLKNGNRGVGGFFNR
jgi:hypothetical protein